MKKKIKLFLFSLLITGLLLGCGLPGDPILDNLYTQNVYPGTASTYSVGSEDMPYSEGWFDDLNVEGNLSVEGESTFSNQIHLMGDGKVWLEFRPDIDFETVRANGKPTWVKRGIIGGWSLPPNAAGEELYMEIHAPNRWDEVSNVYIHVHCYLDTANTGKNFNMELSWAYFSDGDIVPNTSTILTTEIATGTAAQFKSYHMDFILDYDIFPADPLVPSDEIHLKLRRLDASSNEAVGEIVITHIGIVFRRDKLGAETP